MKRQDVSLGFRPSSEAKSITHFAELLAVVAVCDWDIPQRSGQCSAEDEEEEAQTESK